MQSFFYNYGMNEFGKLKNNACFMRSNEFKIQLQWGGYEKACIIIRHDNSVDTLLFCYA